MALSRRIVVVGLGSIGRRHARLLQARRDVQVEVCEPNDTVLNAAGAEVAPCPVFRSYEAALATQPSMVVIATPHHLHRAQTTAALERNIHVLCEKPLSDGLEAARAMCEAAAASRAVLCVGFMLQFHPVIRRLKELMDGGELGEVLAIRYLVGAYGTLVNSLSRYQAGLKGALLFDYAHQPDILHWLTGKRPLGVYMAASQGGTFEYTSCPNCLSMVCDYESPLLTTVELNYVQMPLRHECEVIGDRAWALCDVQKGRIRIGTRRDESEREEVLAYERDALYTAEHQAFLDAVDGKRPPFRSAADASVSMEVIEAALRSWESRSRVELSSVAISQT